MDPKKKSDPSINDSILLDTNVLVSLLLGDNATYADIVTKLKMAALTCEYFVIIGATLEELRGVVRSTEKSIHRLKEEGFPLEIFLPQFDPAKLEDSVEKRINEFLNHKIFKVISEDGIIESADKATLEELESNIAEFIIFSRSNKREGIVRHDARLLLTSKLLSLPILTQDIKIIRLIGKPLSELRVPFPFDSDALDKIELDELIDLAIPMRRLYRKAFLRINKDMSTIQGLKVDLADKDDLNTRQQGILDELSAELREAQTASEQWRKLAHPKADETIIWTIAEILLGFVPIPIPTSPFTYFVQARRFKKLEKQT
jgi:hypothetical protein